MVAGSAVTQAEAMTTYDPGNDPGNGTGTTAGTTAPAAGTAATPGPTSGWSDSGFDAQSARQTFTRPEGLRRSRVDRKLAGVCGGLGLRLGIDPTIVRVGMVVLTIAGGVGIPLYVMLALLMPNEGTSSTAVGRAVGPHLPEQVCSGPGLAVLVVVVALILGAVFGGAFGTNFWDHGGWPWPLIAAGLIGWLVYRKRKNPGGSTGAPAATAASAASATAGWQAQPGRRVEVPVDPSDPGAPGTEFWSRPDPLGLYDTPVGVVTPVRVPTVVKTKRAPILMVLTTLLVAFVSVACLGLFTAAGADIAPVLFAAVPALIVGTGLLIASRLGGSRLLVAAAVLLGLITAGLTRADLPSTFAADTYSRITTSAVYAPASLAAAAKLTSLPNGRNELDLRGLDFGTGTTTLHLALTDGAVEVRLPENLDVNASLAVAPHGWGGIGADHNRFQSTAGGDNGRTVNTTDNGVDGANRGGPHLKLDVAIDHGAVILERTT